jgi:thioredoxin-dependent peroxiredoxin
MYQDFVDNGSVVLGVSSGSQSSHKRFLEKHRLPFPLLVDKNDHLRKQWKVPKSLFLLPGRVTYVLDQSGTIRLIFNSATKVKHHVFEALSIVQQL